MLQPDTALRRTCRLDILTRRRKSVYFNANNRWHTSTNSAGSYSVLVASPAPMVRICVPSHRRNRDDRSCTSTLWCYPHRGNTYCNTFRPLVPYSCKRDARTWWFPPFLLLPCRRAQAKICSVWRVDTLFSAFTLRLSSLVFTAHVPDLALAFQ